MSADHHPTLCAVLTWVLLFVIGPTLAAATNPSAPPNIVIVHADDLGWSDLGCYGAAHHRTPHLDRLARDGMRFTQAYSSAPACTPARAGLLTSRYPARLHVTGQTSYRSDPPRQQFLHPDFRTDLPADVPKLGEMLAQAGYVNGCFGKWGLDNTPESQGFAEAADPGASVDAGKLTDLALDFVRRHARRPFFLYLNHHLVHVPLPPKVEPERIERHRDRLRSTDKNPAYAAAVEKLDEEIGRVIEALGQQDLTRRTLFIFISDNGGFLGTDTEMVTSNAPLREGKASLYEGGIRVPLIVRWPGTVAPGAICSDPVINLDLFPTLAEIIGGPAAKPGGSDGISLVATLRGEPLAPRTLHWHFPHYRRSMAGIAASPSSAMRDGDWKLIHFYADDHIEVFNLARDPGESRDLAATQPAQARRLREKLDEWRRRVDAQPPRPNPAYAPAASRGD